MKLRNKVIVPQGVGGMFPLLITSALFYLSPESFLLAPLIILTLSALIYLYDDWFGLNPIYRSFLIIVTSIIICFLLLDIQKESITPAVIMILMFSAIFFSLVNLLNFYDGADLNVVTFIFLIGISISTCAPDAIYGTELGMILCGMAFGFGILNHRPANLYFGDSGCFAVSGCLVIFLIINSDTIFQSDIRIITPFIIPACDVSAVIIYRILKNENLLTRNFYHLYQRIQIKFGRNWHILVQIVGFFSIITLFEFSKLFELSDWLSFFLASTIVLICTFSITHFLTKPRLRKLGVKS